MPQFRNRAILSKDCNILLADDDPDDRLLIQDALEDVGWSYPVFSVGCGNELMDYLLQQNKYSGKETPRPSLILLDLNMPNKDGFESLREIKSYPSLKHIPIVIFTNSRAEEDIIKNYDNGICSYVVKPNDYNDLVELMEGICCYWFTVVRLPRTNR